MGRDGLPVKPPACAYVGSNPTPATHYCRSGPVCGPGLMCVRGRFRGPFPVPVGQLWARSGQVSDLRWRCPGSARAGIDIPRTVPSGSVFLQVEALWPVRAGSRLVLLSPTAGSCARTPGGRDPAGDYRISWASCGPLACPVTVVEPGHWRSRRVSTRQAARLAFSAYRRLRAHWYI
jgi:hypothetical protein